MIHPAHFDEQTQPTVEQCEVGAGPQRQVERGAAGGDGAARVHHDELCSPRNPAAHPLVQDGMAVGRVRADNQEPIRVLEVLVMSGRAIGTER